MIMTQRLIQCRVELKYFVRTREIIRFLASLGPVLSNPDFRWEQGRISTVYFDRPDGYLTRNALSFPDRSLKIRLREYLTPEDLPSSALVWIEIKERTGVRSRKSRFRLDKSLVSRFLHGDLAEGEILACQDPSTELRRVVEIVHRVRQIAAERELVPVGAVTGRRLALEGGQPAARLTLDQDVSYHLGPFSLYESHVSLDPKALGPASLGEKAGIAELKYQDVCPPRWCERALGQARPVEYSKFQVLCAIAHSEARLD